jgi:uncharacterized membrane protein
MRHYFGQGDWVQAQAFGFPWGGLVLGILVLGIMALLIALIAKHRKPDLLELKERGIDILIERFARGEIDADTFREMKAVIDGGD